MTRLYLAATEDELKRGKMVVAMVLAVASQDVARARRARADPAKMALGGPSPLKDDRAKGRAFSFSTRGVKVLSPKSNGCPRQQYLVLLTSLQRTCTILLQSLCLFLKGQFFEIPCRRE